MTLSLRSVLAQSHADFEVLVVGDGCTDDSEAVVRGCGDTRVRWFNLPVNTGSQWAPNNHGLAEARGVRLIPHCAYFGPGFLASLHLHARLRHHHRQQLVK